MDILTENGISPIDFAYYSALFILGMVAFHNRNRPGLRVVYYIWMGAFMVTWGVALLSPRQLPTKIFISLLLLSTVIVQTSLARRTSGPRSLAK